MAMTGMSFIIGRKDAIEASAAYPTRSYYCNLYLQYDYFQKHGEMHFTPPVQVIYAARQALKEYFDEGEEAKTQRGISNYIQRTGPSWISDLYSAGNISRACGGCAVSRRSKLGF